MVLPNKVGNWLIQGSVNVISSNDLFNLGILVMVMLEDMPYIMRGSLAEEIQCM